MTAAAMKTLISRRLHREVGIDAEHCAAIGQCAQRPIGGTVLLPSRQLSYMALTRTIYSPCAR
eukprot:scaffold56670_cov34-Tisochrysis_lutea.AAC.1